jgi:UDP-glucuronate 4-epimerase
VKTAVVTGAAGFVGFHVAKHLLDRGYRVFGHDNLNPYYSPKLKVDRISRLQGTEGWTFIQGELEDAGSVSDLVASAGRCTVIHLGAQAGVRWSISNPGAYIGSNIVGFANILEACRHGDVDHLVYASSSSVYGANSRVPFRVSDRVDHPVSLYAATKRSNEAMAHAYSHLFRMPCTGLRFFTVYGPWGRPDMAYWKFTEAILRGEPLELFGDGELERDFTYIDDVVSAVARVAECPATPDPAWNGEAPNAATSQSPWRIYNIGNHSPVRIRTMLSILEELCGRKALVNLKPIPAGDVPRTFADVDDLRRDFGFAPNTPLESGLAQFVNWYREWAGT